MKHVKLDNQKTIFDFKDVKAFLKRKETAFDFDVEEEPKPEDVENLKKAYISEIGLENYRELKEAINAGKKSDVRAILKEVKSDDLKKAIERLLKYLR